MKPTIVDLGGPGGRPRPGRTRSRDAAAGRLRCNGYERGFRSEAVAATRHQQPDLMISDIGMPDVDGYQLLRSLRARGEARFPAIALTAFARPEDRTDTLLAGYVAHVSKPVEPAELIATVAAVSGRVV